MITLTAADILEAALKLPEHEREQIAHKLWESVPPLPKILYEDDPGFVEELDRRMEEHRRDPSTAVSWDEVRDELRKRFGELSS